MAVIHHGADLSNILEVTETVENVNNDAGAVVINKLAEAIHANRIELQQLTSKLRHLSIRENNGGSNSSSPAVQLCSSVRPEPHQSTQSPISPDVQYIQEQYRDDRSHGNKTCSSFQRDSLLCDRCNRIHNGDCFAKHVYCFNCRKRGHLKVCCRDGVGRERSH